MSNIIENLIDYSRALKTGDEDIIMVDPIEDSKILDEAIETIQSLQAENERLREGLKEIKDAERALKEFKEAMERDVIPNVIETLRQRQEKSLQIKQCLESEVKSNPLDEDYILPCDVKVYPATTITKGCKLGTLLKSIKLRESEA